MKRLFTAIYTLMGRVLYSLGERLSLHLEWQLARTGALLYMAGGMPRPGAYEQYRVTSPNDSEENRQRLYDHLLYAAAGQLNLTFYSTQVGQGITTAPGATVGTPKTYQDTNMDSPSSLPSGKEYLIESIEVYFYPGSSNAANTFTPVFAATTDTAALAVGTVNAMNDVQAFYESGLLEFWVLDKNQLRETPLRSFPPKTNMELAAGVATAVGGAPLSIVAQNMHPVGRPYIMEPQISLQPVSTFRVNLLWPSLYALPSAKNGRVGVYFDGIMKRAAQ